MLSLNDVTYSWMLKHIKIMRSNYLPLILSDWNTKNMALSMNMIETHQSKHSHRIHPCCDMMKSSPETRKTLAIPPAQCHISRRILIPLTPLTFAGFEYIDDGNRFEYVCGRQHESIAAAWRAEQFSMWMIPY